MATTPKAIYERYKIMPNLQLHQLRVAAVAKMVCDHFKHPVRASDVVLAALFHDMGNIIKFDLARFPEFTEEKGVPYWQEVKAEYVGKYGTDHHAASIAIAKEMGLPENIAQSIGRVTFLNLVQIRDEKEWEQKIVDYADLRVAPTGVFPMTDRIEEAHRRYLVRHPADSLPKGDFDELVQAALDIEKQLFAECSLVPADITDASVSPIVEELWKYPVNGT